MYICRIIIKQNKMTTVETAKQELKKVNFYQIIEIATKLQLVAKYRALAKLI